MVLPQGMCLTVQAGPLELALLVVTDLLVTEGFGLSVERVTAVVRVDLLEPHYFGASKMALCSCKGVYSFCREFFHLLS